MLMCISPGMVMTLVTTSMIMPTMTMSFVSTMTARCSLVLCIGSVTISRLCGPTATALRLGPKLIKNLKGTKYDLEGNSRP